MPEELRREIVEMLGNPPKEEIQVAMKQVTEMLMAQGYSPEEALDELKSVYNPCLNEKTPKQIVSPLKEGIKAPSCAFDEARRKDFDEFKKTFIAENSEKDPATKDAGSQGSGREGGKIAEQAAIEAAGGSSSGDKAPPPAPAAPGNIAQNSAPPLPRLAPELGPAIGGSRGMAMSSGGTPGHKGVAFSSSTKPARSGSETTPAQNLEIVRQALDQKVVQREITPAMAETLINKLAPVLQKEPNLSRALEKAGMAMVEPAKPSAEPEKVQRAEIPLAEAVEKPTAQKPATKSAAAASTEKTAPTQEAPKTIPGFFALGGPTVDSVTAEIKKGLMGDSLASSLAAALTKKNAILSADQANESGTNPIASGSTGGAGVNTQALASGGLFSNETLDSEVETQPIARAKKGFRDFIHRMSAALGGPTRTPASSKEQAAFEHFQETASLALASVGRTGEISFHPSISPWLPVFFFLTPFSLTLVGFAIWQWRRRRHS